MSEDGTNPLSRLNSSSDDSSEVSMEVDEENAVIVQEVVSTNGDGFQRISQSDKESKESEKNQPDLTITDTLSFSDTSEEGFTAIPQVEAEPVCHRKKSSDKWACIALFKYAYSSILLFFCVAIVMAGIFKKENAGYADYNMPPLVAFTLFWFLIAWLAIMEGGQGCLVGLLPIPKEKYADSHPKTLKNTSLVHKGNNMERFIVGRQFLVVIVIFVINMCGAAAPNTSVFGFPPVFANIFLDNGLALIIVTIVIGALTSQINAAVCMLDFIDNYFMLFTSYLGLAIEATGLLHCVYLVQYAFALFTRSRIPSNEPPRSKLQNFLFWGRVVLSTMILGFSLSVTMKALIDGNSGMWNGVPVWASFIIFFSLLCFVGLLEGMQIAAFALVNMPEEELVQYSIAYANCQLIFSGKNLQAFLVGRQILVASLMFIVARIASISADDGSYNIFGASASVQSFYNTGLLGAVVLTVVGSLVWRIIASSLPLAFMSNPMIYIIIKMCLILEYSGICASSWVLAHFHKRLLGWQKDEAYLMEPKKTVPEAEDCI